MSVTIAAPLVSELLGGSVIYGEYKGNLAKARQASDRFVAAMRDGGDARALADALLARGMVLILQGHTSAAIRNLEEIGSLALDGPVPGLRAEIYISLATYIHYGLKPDRWTFSSSDIADQWDEVAWVTAEDARARQRDARIAELDNPELRVESALMHGVLPFVATFNRSVSTPFAPEQRQMVLEQGLQVMHGAFLTQTQSLGVSASLLAYTDLVAADLCRQARKLERAQNFVERAHALYMESQDYAGAATCRMMQGDWQVAPRSTVEAWNLHLEEGLGSALAEEVEEFDRAWSTAGIPVARTAYADAEALFRRGGAPRGLAALQLRRAYLAVLQGDYSDAFRRLSRAEREFAAVGDECGRQVARAHRALALVGAGQHFDDITIATNIGEWGLHDAPLAFALGLGLLFVREGRRWLMSEGDYERAMACSRQAGALFRRMDARTNAALALQHEGDAYYLANDYAAALDRFEQAFDLLQRLADGQGPSADLAWVRAAFLGMSILSSYDGRDDSDGMRHSADRLERLIELEPASEYRSDGPPPEPGMVTTDMDTRGTIAEALRHQIRFGRFHATLKDGQRKRAAGDEVGGQMLFDQALAIARQSGEADTVPLWEAAVLVNRRSRRQSAAWLHRFFDERIERTTRHLAEASGGPEDVLNLVRQQLHDTHQQAAAAFANLRAYRTAAGYLDALDQLQGAYARANVNEHPWVDLATRAEIREGVSDLTAALNACDRAIVMLEERRARLSRDELKVSLAGERTPQGLYFQAARLCVKLEKIAAQTDDTSAAMAWSKRGFRYIELGKARGLLDLLASDASVARTSLTDNQDRQTWHRLNARLATWRELLAQERSKPLQSADTDRVAYFERQVDADENELRQLLKRIASSDRGFHQVVNPQADVAAVEDVATSLPPDTALLQYAFLGNDLLVWAVTRSSITRPYRRRVDARALAREIRAFHADCQARTNTHLAGEHLAAVLLAPLARIINKYGRLIIVPYGATNVLPFHALPWRGQPLGASRIVSYVPSASALQFARKRGGTDAPAQALCVGNPSNMRLRRPGGETISFPQVPGTAVQAALVSRHLSGSVLRIGRQATLQSVQRELSHLPILHFATHGILSKQAPLLSSILLANGEAMTAYDFLGLQVTAELVVLSACETGRGESTGGEELLGLVRCLLAGGAASTVVTLWPVDEIASTLLIDRFYAALRRGADKATALAQAQSSVRTISVADAIAWCREVMAVTRTSSLVSARRRLDRAIADLEFVAHDFEAALASYTVLRGGANSASNADQELALAQFRCRRALRDPTRVDYAVRPYAMPFYWAAFVLVGNWE